MFLDRKPFHLKNKFLFQTKINLWEKDIRVLRNSLRKRKWDFLRYYRFRRYNRLCTFRYEPFSYNPFKKRIRYNFKNNLYLRMLIRLKFARLSDKEFYSICKKSENYSDLIMNLGSRLDVVVYNFLVPVSVFLIRQNILHGKILVNGRKVVNPGFKIESFDVISFNLIDISNMNYIYNSQGERSMFFRQVARPNFIYFSCDKFEELTEQGKDLFLDVAIKNLNLNFLKNFFKKDLEEGIVKGFNSYNKKRGQKLKISMNSYIAILESFFIIVKIYEFIKSRQRNNFFYKNLKFFFDENLIFNNMEIFYYKTYVDILYLNNNLEFRDIHSNKKMDRYILRYLFPK
jgi:ribosomal protein S4